MNIPELHQLFLSSNGITTDTRRISEGQLFFALKGPNFDGNKYAHRAIELGCVLSIIDDEELEANEHFVFVGDVLETLQALAIFHRRYLGVPIVAITGSNGKTTTKELLRSCLSSKFNVAATEGNFNNHIGVPLTLLSFKEDTEIGIVELGTNDIGEIAALCRIAQPTHGIITSIGKAHLENLKSEDGVFKEKTALFKYLEVNHGVIFINESSQRLAEFKPVTGTPVRFSTEGNKELNVHIKHSFPLIDIDIKFGANVGNVKLDLFGIYNIQNVVGAITIGQYFNLSLSEIVAGLSKFKNANNRCEIVNFNGNTVFLDAYNANPSSVKEALIAFDAYEASNKIVILGDMLELGEHAENEHRYIINLCESISFVNTVFIGEYFYSLRKNIFDNARFFEDTGQAKEFVQYLMSESNQYVYIKGSRGIGLEKLLS